MSKVFYREADNISESFTCDNFESLTSSPVSGRNSVNITYSSNENILSKTGVGNYYYNENKINAVDSILNNPGSIYTPQIITYTSFNKASFITDTINSLDIFYGPDRQRIKTVYKEEGTPVKIKYYSDNFEKDTTANGARYISYIYCPYGLVAINIEQNDADSIYFVDSDHLGSILALIKPDGSVAEEYSYDTWGRRRSPDNWSYTVSTESLLTDRGFTGHEHYDAFELIDMNGRIYDPLIGRFLSPDPVIQSPDFTQSFNSYSYCINNPLKYFDASGFSYSDNDNDSFGDPNHYTIEQMLAMLFGAIWGDFLPSQASLAGEGKPGEGGNGDGSKGIYYDYKTGKWRRTCDNSEIDMKLVTIILQGLADVKVSQYKTLLQNEKEGLFRIWSSSFTYQSEYGGLITLSGVITFFVGVNGGDLFGGLKTTWKGDKCFVDLNGESYQVLGSIHVHYDKTYDPGLSWWDPRDGSGDISAAYYTLRGKVPLFVLSWDDKIYSISYTGISYTDYLSKFTVSSLFTGQLSLIQMLK